jgi:tetratricopeptide (TPR) repeat protein
LQSKQESTPETAVENTLDAAVLFQEGLSLVLSDPSAAQEALGQAVAMDPSYRERANSLQNAMLLASRSEDPAYAAIQIGQALAAVGAWPEAKAAFAESVTQDESYAEAWAYLGEARDRTGEDGLDALKKALSLNPDSISANYFLALHYQRAEQPEIALVYLQHAASVVPESPALQADIGQTLVTLGNIEDARDHYERLVTLTPDDPQAWLLMAGFAINNELYLDEIGIPAARQALILAPDDPRAMTLLGRAYALSGEEVLAARFFEQAIAIDTDYGPAYTFYGLMLVTMGEGTKAQSYLQEAVALQGTIGAGAKAQEALDRFFP